MKYNRYILASASALLIALSACTGNFEEYNKNPYGPTAEDMLGDNVETGMLIKNMLPAIVQGQQNNSQMIDQMVGLEYGGHASMINPWGNSGNFYTYNPREGWYGIPFTTTMPQIYTNYFKIAEKTGKTGVVYAWSQIIRVAASMKVSDCYGPIPYSKVDGDSYTVAYDSEQDLYNAMFNDLDQAIQTISAAVASGANFTTLSDFDYVYGGDFKKWIKYANSLQLRMAMRIVNADPELARKKAEEAVASGVMTDANDAAYSSFNDGMNPFYRASYTWNGGEFRISASLTSFMNGYADPRLDKYATACEQGYVGVRNGISQTASTFAAYQEFSYPQIGDNDKLLIMSTAEVYFLRAEGALRGWDMGGKAQDLYEEGIRTSMTEKGASLGTYLANENEPADYTDHYKSANSCKKQTTICPKWDDAASFETNLERIITQKWIATYPSGWETWADVRRTGYPKLLPVVNNLSNGVVSSQRGMRRLPFPMDEYNTNTANVQAAAAMLGGADNAGTDLWWAKKN